LSSLLGFHPGIGLKAIAGGSKAPARKIHIPRHFRLWWWHMAEINTLQEGICILTRMHLMEIWREFWEAIQNKNIRGSYKNFTSQKNPQQQLIAIGDCLYTERM
jgi:hypothetical protein